MNIFTHLKKKAKASTLPVGEKFNTDEEDWMSILNPTRRKEIERLRDTTDTPQPKYNPDKKYMSSDSWYKLMAEEKRKQAIKKATDNARGRK
jgi:hypothetical protein